MNVLLNYGRFLRFNSYANNLQTLIVTQKYIMKIICGESRDHQTEKPHSESKILRMRELYYLNTLKIIQRKQHKTNNSADTYSSWNKFKSCHMHIYFMDPKLHNLLPVNITNVENPKTRYYYAIKSRYSKITGE